MSQTLVAFAAKGIQDYIFASNRLREIIGASELIDQLCTGFLNESLEKLGLGGECISLVQAAGWGRLLFKKEEAAKSFCRYWPLLVEQYAPGIQMVQTYLPVTGDLGKTLQEASLQLEQRRNSPAATLPEIGPLVERAPRTGMAAVIWQRDKKKSDKREAVDAATLRKLAVLGQEKDTKGSGHLIKKIKIDSKRKIVWTDDINLLAAGGESGYVAIVHADGNGLGQLVINLGKNDSDLSDTDTQEKYSRFSKLIDEVNQEAVKEAFEKVLLPSDSANSGENGKTDRTSDDQEPTIIGARPVVLGGDDLTIILRADLAVPFVRSYLEAFEMLSEQKLTKFNKDFELKLTTRLTACAGIAFAKSSYPFSSAVTLAEELCGEAKTAGREVGQPSSLMFHRISSSVCGSFDELAARELYGADSLKLWLGPYRVGSVDAESLPALKDLEALADVLSGLSRGSIRQLLTDLAIDRRQADLSFQRLCQVADSRHKHRVEELKNALKILTGQEDAPYSNSGTPLLEAYLLNEMTGKQVKGVKNG